MPATPPNDTKLYEAALNHLARYPATEISLARVLARKLERWGRRHAGEDTSAAAIEAAIKSTKHAIPAIIARLKAENLLSDSAFATSREKRLRRQGKSRRYALAHLAAKGVPAATAQTILPENPTRELAAACAFLRRRKAGPFGDTAELKILAAMARTGFSQQISRQALRLSRGEAEDLIKTLNEPYPAA